jgi:spermidine synthase/MFS family permease
MRKPAFWREYLGVAVASFAGMAIEMAGARILAPFFGTSQIVWAALIGVILAAIAAGSYLGGRLADRLKNPRKTLAGILSIASLLICGIAFLKNLLLFAFSYLGIFGLLASTIALFGPVSILLPMLTPIAIKTIQSAPKPQKTQGEPTFGAANLGENVGRVYAISTCGSIVGTFATSFIFIPLVGNAWILVILAACLALTALLFVWKHPLQLAAVVCSFAISFYPISAANLFTNAREIDTLYANYILIDDGTGVRLRVYGAIESMKPHDASDGDLVVEYLKYYDLAFHFKHNTKRALCIGGAGYVYPQYFVKTYPEANIDVVEIDPKMEKIARKYFGLETGPRLKSIIQDARSFLNRNTKKYDAIFGDAFKNSSPPYECLTREACKLISNSLTDDGVYIANIISSEEGADGRLFQSYLNTLRAVFPTVLTFRTFDEYKSGRVNLILVGLKTSEPPLLVSPEPNLQKLLDRNFTPKETKQRILTDDRSPVEYFTMFY